ncbi:putative reverse transcriptase domain-containing protein [Tanacetum coccineum]
MMDDLELTRVIIMANVPSNDPNVDAPANVPAPVNPEHAPAQPWTGKGKPKEDPKEDPEEDPKEDPKENDENDWEVDDEAEVIKPYTGDDLNNPPTLIFRRRRTPTTSLLFPDADVVPTGPMGPNLGTIWRRMRDMEKLMMERIDTEGRIKKKFKEQDRHFVGLGCDNVEIDRTVRKVMSNLSGVKELVKGLSDRFDEYERSKVFKDKKILEEELVNERNRKDFYREFGEYMCRMLQKRQKSEDGLTVPSGSQVRKPPAEPFARSAPALRSDDPYVVARDAAAAVTTSDIDDDDDTASMDSQPYEPRGSPRDSQYRHRLSEKEFEMKQNHAGGTNIAPLLGNVPLQFMKCTEGNKVVFAAATFQDRALTWWNSQVATSGMEAVTRKTWAEMKVMMTEEFCPLEEIQRMEYELWNLRVKDMDISSYTTRFNELALLCPDMVPMEQKKVEAYIRGFSENIKGEVTSSEPTTMNKVVWMVHTLMEQKVKAKQREEVDNKKRKWENFHGGSSSGGGYNNW